MECRFCNCKCIKKGKQKNGAQKYFCRNCNKHQIGHYRRRTFLVANSQIILLVKEGCCIRSIARILKIAVNTVMTRIRKIARAIVPPPIRDNARFEVDELRTFVGRKENEYWIGYSIERSTGAVASYKVGKRNKTNLKTVLLTLFHARAKQIRTDGLKLYRFLIPEKQLNIKQHCINRMERKNLNLRTHLKRLSRRTICFSRSVAMLYARVRMISGFIRNRYLIGFE